MENKTFVPKYEEEWDEYWKKPKTIGNITYDVIASFYRTLIIRPALNRFIKKYFPPKSKLLHAGCGSGQVDTEISRIFAIIGLDISANALEINRKVNDGRCQLVKGDIFSIPFPKNSMDGVYNLGVMEHFSREDIQKILSEFHRVLKEDGKVVIFWPPEFGSSVSFMKVVEYLLRRVFGKRDVKLRPDEISRIQSKTEAIEIFRRADFEVLEYYFGPRDFFTHSIIVARKGSS